MLSEAHLASESFSDPALTARILYLLGGLSYIEAQYKQAVNFCSEAQVGIFFLKDFSSTNKTNKLSHVLLLEKYIC